ncbi:MAG: hypothetical protein AB1480_11285 [Nitrospirota bacterium]
MSQKILLINPWIYDFAAFNFWVRPLGLLKVAEHLSTSDVELSFIDCMDSFEVKRYGIGRFKTEQVEKPCILKDIPRLYKRYGISIREFVERLNASSPVDAAMLTCVMSYWYPGVQKAVEIIREILGSVCRLSLEGCPFRCSYCASGLLIDSITGFHFLKSLDVRIHLTEFSPIRPTS